MIAFLYTWLYVKKIKKFIQSKNFSLTSDEATQLNYKSKIDYYDNVTRCRNFH